MTSAARGHHLTLRGRVWLYNRRRPKVFEDVEPKRRITFSLGTSDFSEAKLLAAQHTVALDRRWRDAKERGVSLASDDAARRHDAAVGIAREFGLSYAPADKIDHAALLERLRALIAADPSPPEQKAVLGLVDEPKLTLMQAYERFWEHIRDEWTPLNTDQRRMKRNAFLRSIRSFEGAVGQIALHDLKREHALEFRTWWINRLEEEHLAPTTANREISVIRRLISVNYDIDSVDRPKSLRQSSDQGHERTNPQTVRDGFHPGSPADAGRACASGG